MKLKFKFQKFFKSIFLLFLIILIYLLIFLSYKFSISKELASNQKIIINDQKQENVNIYEVQLTDEWSITIHKINLINAKIREGVDDITLNSFVGHFDNTSTYVGNVGLAAHNRGYNVNYFSDINKLEIGDEIIYMYQNQVLKYKVILKTIIDSYDWSYLKETNDNRITLITCVDNRPDLRLCIQGIEYKEE